MNKVILFGNVGGDPDVKRLESGSMVAKFGLATNKRYTNKQGETITETQWHNIVMWDKPAEIAEKWVKKGSAIIVEGEIQYRQYQDKDGNTKYITEIICDRFHFAGGKKEETRSDENTGSAYKEAIVNKSKEEGFNSDDLSDLPF